MPTTDRGYVYPESGDHTRLWEHLQSLADSVDDDLGAVLAQIPLRFAVLQTTINLVAEAFETEAVVFPVGRFSVAPRVFVSSGSSFYLASFSNVTADGCDVTARHNAGTVTTIDVLVNVLAIQFDADADG